MASDMSWATGAYIRIDPKRKSERGIEEDPRVIEPLHLVPRLGPTKKSLSSVEIERIRLLLTIADSFKLDSYPVNFHLRKKNR